MFSAQFAWVTSHYHFIDQPTKWLPTQQMPSCQIFLRLQKTVRYISANIFSRGVNWVPTGILQALSSFRLSISIPFGSPMEWHSLPSTSWDRLMRRVNIIFYKRHAAIEITYILIFNPPKRTLYNPMYLLLKRFFLHIYQFFYIVGLGGHFKRSGIAKQTFRIRKKRIRLSFEEKIVISLSYMIIKL